MPCRYLHACTVFNIAPGDAVGAVLRSQRLHFALHLCRTVAQGQEPCPRQRCSVGRVRGLQEIDRLG
jgi:hypothetical protein